MWIPTIASQAFGRSPPIFGRDDVRQVPRLQSHQNDLREHSSFIEYSRVCVQRGARTFLSAAMNFAKPGQESPRAAIRKLLRTRMSALRKADTFAPGHFSWSRCV